VGYQSQHKDKFIYLYSLLCILCMIASSVSVESIVIEDQLTQVGHFFFYNILTGDSPLENSYQLKVCRYLCICTFMLSMCLCINLLYINVCNKHNNYSPLKRSLVFYVYVSTYIHIYIKKVESLP